MFNRVTINKYIDNQYKLVNKRLSFKDYHKKSKNLWITNNEKLYNNIIRAKTTILDYCMCNRFKYFVTITINNDNDRFDLDWLQRNTSQIIRNLRVKYGGDFKYILIPEQHKDGAWHMHGLFDSDFENDFYINKNGYLSWSSYDYIGFSSISIIYNYMACIKYITKYVKKDFEKREKSKHLYFCSHNLLKSNKILDIVVTNDNIDYSYINEYCKILNFTEDDKEYVLNELNSICYSILEDKECLIC